MSKTPWLPKSQRKPEVSTVVEAEQPKLSPIAKAEARLVRAKAEYEQAKAEYEQAEVGLADARKAPA